jgi:hypothetical protein
MQRWHDARQMANVNLFVCSPVHLSALQVSQQNRITFIISVGLSRKLTTSVLQYNVTMPIPYIEPQIKPGMPQKMFNQLYFGLNRLSS